MKRIFLIVFFMELLCSFVWAQDEPQKIQQQVSSPSTLDWTFSTSVNYSTGNFGTDTTTNTIYVPFTLQRNFAQSRVSWTIPYIYQTSGSQVSAIAGRPYQIRRSGDNTQSTSGVGDMLLKGGYDLLREPSGPLDLSLLGTIKFPTANKNKGLGTGEFDEGVGLFATKSLDKNWFVLGEVGYAFIGDPPGTSLNNEFLYAAGIGYRWSEATSSSISYEERTSLLDDRPNPRDLIIGIDHKLNKTVGLFGDVSFGLSKGSPDTALTAGMSVSF